MFSKKTTGKIVFVGLMLLPLLAPAIAFAQTAAAMPNIWPLGYWAPNGILSCTGNYVAVQAGQAGSIPPCVNLGNLIQTILNIIALMMSIAIFIILPVLIVWGAAMLMMGGANPEMLSKGKKMITGTLVGLAIILCSYLIISTLVGIFHISGLGGFS